MKILKTAGVDFAILGTEESCNGDSARRLGQEYLFQMMAENNIQTLNKYNFKKIITA
ncbi:(Fe-S)-binding protein, partial [candidate division KSB1 bacterium]|nr:(Fe-S)-binding protein [candidate division KSB1 bacterium]